MSEEYKNITNEEFLSRVSNLSSSLEDIDFRFMLAPSGTNSVGVWHDRYKGIWEVYRILNNKTVSHFETKERCDALYRFETELIYAAEYERDKWWSV